MKKYEVSFEIEGDMALFTDPASGSTARSYPAPTYSSLRGMFDSVALLGQAYISPTKVEICKPLQWMNYKYNFNITPKKQIHTQPLFDVCYKVYGECIITQPSSRINHAHFLQDLFIRNLKKGRRKHTPFLGCKEFIPKYFGELRNNTQAILVNVDIISMLHHGFDPCNFYILKEKNTHIINAKDSEYLPKFIYNVKIRDGVLDFTEYTQEV